MSPHQYYNAIALLYQGNYPDIARAKKQFRDWRAAWEEIKKDARFNPEQEWERLARHDVRLLLATDETFPLFLREIPAPPFGIYVKGALIFDPPTVAIVGTRRATNEGRRLSEQFGADLARRGITIVSGLALGIDGAAHRGALSAGSEPNQKGKTIAVLPSGLDYIYPSSHTRLAQEIVACGGALVSEYPFQTPAFPNHFLERNRIISGLCLGTLVIEAPDDSGALVTAKCAVDQNRDVFVVPGPLTHPNYRGSHRLVQQGAALVTSADDICEQLNLPIAAVSAPQTAHHFSPEEQLIVASVTAAGAPLTIDKISEITQLEPHVVMQTITLLTVHGMIKEDSGRYYI